MWIKTSIVTVYKHSHDSKTIFFLWLLIKHHNRVYIMFWKHCLHVKLLLYLEHVEMQIIYIMLQQIYQVTFSKTDEYVLRKQFGDYL